MADVVTIFVRTWQPLVDNVIPLLHVRLDCVKVVFVASRIQPNINVMGILVLKTANVGRKNVKIQLVVLEILFINAMVILVVQIIIVPV